MKKTLKKIAYFVGHPIVWKLLMGIGLLIAIITIVQFLYIEKVYGSSDMGWIAYNQYSAMNDKIWMEFFVAVVWVILSLISTLMRAWFRED